MDDEGGMPSSFSNNLYTDTVRIYVESEWGSPTQTGIQLCPAVFVPNVAQIPQAVKHIYSRLAASAAELDQGVPELLLSLVGTGNSFSFENSERIVHGLGQLIRRCSLWAVSSGEQNDPLAVAISTALRSTLLTDSNGREETLQIVVNCADVQHQIGPSPPFNSPQSLSAPLIMTDARLNTFYMVWARNSPSPHQMLIFRACAAIKLANPPPAFLIGVPEERVSANFGAQSQAQTPLGPSGSPAAILLPSASSIERQPLPLVIFAGATLNSLIELVVYVQCGVPALLIQDISELCVMLKAAFSLYQSAGFEHSAFDRWLDGQLRMVATATEGNYSKRGIEDAKMQIFQLLMTVSSADHSLLAFISAQQINYIGEHALDLLVRNASDSIDLSRALELAFKIGATKTLNSIRLEGLLGEEELASILKAAISSSENGLDVLTTLMDQNVPLAFINSNFLIDWAQKTDDQYFFQTIILGHLLNLHPNQFHQIDQQIANRLNQLMANLCGYVSNCLFPVELFHPPICVDPSPTSSPVDRCIRLLAVWSFLLHRPQFVRLFCAYSPDPLPLCLALAKCARALAHQSGPWFFYEHSLIRLANQLSHFAFQLLERANSQDQAKAYNALCRPLPTFRHLTLTQLAYQTNSCEFIAHECCQRWVLRLLYGHIQIRSFFRFFPNWLKILLSAIFVLPIGLWIRPKGNLSLFWGPNQEEQRVSSPTVAFLEEGRQMNKVRSSSTNSLRNGPFGGIRGGGGGGGGGGDEHYQHQQNQHLRRNSGTIYGGGGELLATNGGGGRPMEMGQFDTDPMQQAISTNDDSTLTDSFLPSASQINHQRVLEIEARRRREEADALLLNQQRAASRRQSPDRRSLMFFDGASGGGGSLNRRRSRTSSSRLLGGPQIGGKLGLEGGIGQNQSGGGGYFDWGISCLSLLALFYSTPIAKYWLWLAFRLLYLFTFGWVISQPGCFLSGWREQCIWLWALCWMIDSIWVFVCRSQLGNWRQHFWTIFDLVICGFFLSSLLAMRIFASTGWIGWPSAYEIRANWAFFLLYECHKTIFLFVPLSNVLGPMLVRIRLMITRDLANFFLLIILLLFGSALAIKAALFPDLSANPGVMGETFGWTFQQLFITDLAILRQSGECHRQLLPEKRPFCQAIGGYADPRCPKQHLFASFTVFHYFFLLKLLSWPILFALFARTAKRVEEEADQIWRFQLYELATGFSVRPCLPPPLTPLFLFLLAFCRFGGGDLSCIFPVRVKSNGSKGCCPLLAGIVGADHPDSNGIGPHTTHPKFANVYKNPSVLCARGRPLTGYWRRLAIDLWKKEAGKSETATKAGKLTDMGKSAEGDRATLLIGFNTMRGQSMPMPIFEEATKGGEEEEDGDYGKIGSTTTRLKVDPNHRNWFHLMPNYRPNFNSKETDQFPIDLQKHAVDDASTQNIVELGKHWRQRKLAELLRETMAEEEKVKQTQKQFIILLNGNGLPLNPSGRTGLAGRGDFARFGPNRMHIYAIFRRQNRGGQIQVIVQFPSAKLPSRWAYSASGGGGSRQIVDEFLAQLLLQLGLADPEIHSLSTKTGLAEGQRDGPIGLACTEKVDEGKMGKNDGSNWPMETDNAWAERRLWAVDLSGFGHLHQQLGEGGEFDWKLFEEWEEKNGEEGEMLRRAIKMFKDENGDE